MLRVCAGSSPVGYPMPPQLDWTSGRFLSARLSVRFRPEVRKIWIRGGEAVPAGLSRRKSRVRIPSCPRLELTLRRLRVSSSGQDSGFQNRQRGFESRCSCEVLERWPRGRRRAVASGEAGQPVRGFESLPLRAVDDGSPNGWAVAFEATMCRFESCSVNRWLGPGHVAQSGDAAACHRMQV